MTSSGSCSGPCSELLLQSLVLAASPAKQELCVPAEEPLERLCNTCPLPAASTIVAAGEAGHRAFFIAREDGEGGKRPISPHPPLPFSHTKGSLFILIQVLSHSNLLHQPASRERLLMQPSQAELYCLDLLIGSLRMGNQIHDNLKLDK